MNEPKSFESLKSAIRGPVFPILTPFKENGDVDYTALYRYVDYLVSAGAPVILGTVGTSRFNLLTREEMLTFNETLVAAVNGRAVTIVAGPGPNHGSTRENICFAQHAHSIGADGILVLYPERWYGERPVVEFFRDVAESTHCGIMIHALPMRDGFGGVKALKYFDADLLEKIISIPNIIGVKEENGERPVFEEMLARFKKRAAIIGAGGCMRRFLKDQQLGSISYLVGIGSFKPELAITFFNAVMDDDRQTAERIAQSNEDPYFEFAVRLGWHRALKETLYLLNLMPPHERKPLTRISDNGRQELITVLAHCGWLQENEYA